MASGFPGGVLCPPPKWRGGEARFEFFPWKTLEIKRTLDGAVQTFSYGAAEVTPRRGVLLYTISKARRIADVYLSADTVSVA